MSANGRSILALVTDGFGATGGIARYNRDLLSALARSEQVSRIKVLPRAGQPDAELPDRLHQFLPIARPAPWAVAAARHALFSRPAVIFCGHLHAAPLALALARATGARFWLQVHGIEAWRRPGPAIRAAVGHADLITSVSRHTRRCLLNWAEVNPSRVKVLPNMFSPPPSIDRAEARATLVRRFGLEGRRIILTVGRYSTAERYKGHDRVIRALSCVAKHVPNVSHLIVGEGDDHPRLLELAAKVGVADRIVFAGHVGDGKLAEIYAASDVFAMPSTGEGFGIVFLEALAAGLPVVAGNQDGSVDPVADGALGTLVDPTDHDALVAALVDALEGRASGNPLSVSRFAEGNFSRHVDALFCRHLAEQKHIAARSDSVPVRRDAGVELVR